MADFCNHFATRQFKNPVFMPVTSDNPLFELPNKIVVLNFFVKDICYDLTPFGFSCPNRLDCLS